MSVFSCQKEPKLKDKQIKASSIKWFVSFNVSDEILYDNKTIKLDVGCRLFVDKLNDMKVTFECNSLGNRNYMLRGNSFHLITDAMKNRVLLTQAAERL